MQCKERGWQSDDRRKKDVGTADRYLKYKTPRREHCLSWYKGVRYVQEGKIKREKKKPLS